MDQNKKPNQPSNNQPITNEDLQSSVNDLTVDAQTPAPSPTVPVFEATKEPLSLADQKLQSSWSESLPQTTLSDTINIEKEQIKLDQPQSSPEHELRTTPISTPDSQPPNQEVPLIADIIPEAVDPQQPPVVPNFPQPTPPPTPPKNTAKLINIKIIAVLFFVILVAVVASLLYFKKIPQFNFSLPDRLGKKAATESVTLTPSQKAQTTTPTIVQGNDTSDTLPHRKLSWFVPIPPSITPSDLSAGWIGFKSDSISFKYPKDWKLVDVNNQLPPGVTVEVYKLFNPPTDDPLNKSPIEIVIVNSPKDTTTLINSFIGEKAKEITKTQAAINNFPATKTSNETGPSGESVQRFFITVSGQVVVLTLRPQAEEDQLIFEIIANSITVN